RGGALLLLQPPVRERRRRRLQGLVGRRQLRPQGPRDAGLPLPPPLPRLAPAARHAERRPGRETGAVPEVVKPPTLLPLEGGGAPRTTPRSAKIRWGSLCLYARRTK